MTSSEGKWRHVCLQRAHTSTQIANKFFASDVSIYYDVFLHRAPDQHDKEVLLLCQDPHSSCSRPPTLQSRNAPWYAWWSMMTDHYIAVFNYVSYIASWSWGVYPSIHTGTKSSCGRLFAEVLVFIPSHPDAFNSDHEDHSHTILWYSWLDDDVSLQFFNFLHSWFQFLVKYIIVFSIANNLCSELGVNLEKWTKNIAT